jgi:hypothetical protein
MARAKSNPGSKTSRAKNNIEQTGNGVTGNPPEVEVKPVVEPQAAAPTIKATPEFEPTHPGKTPAEAKAVAEPRPASDGRKFEVMKTDARKNLVPINLEDEIRRRAYELYQERGSVSGNEAEDWLIAEREIRQRYHQQSA